MELSEVMQNKLVVAAIKAANATLPFYEAVAGGSNDKDKLYDNAKASAQGEFDRMGVGAEANLQIKPIDGSLFFKHVAPPFGQYTVNVAEFDSEGTPVAGVIAAPVYKELFATAEDGVFFIKFADKLSAKPDISKDVVFKVTKKGIVRLSTNGAMKVTVADLDNAGFSFKDKLSAASLLRVMGVVAGKEGWDFEHPAGTFFINNEQAAADAALRKVGGGLVDTKTGNLFVYDGRTVSPEGLHFASPKWLNALRAALIARARGKERTNER